MEFTNEFRVPSDIETTFATLTDLEKVAPCLPGATLEEVDGDVYSGKVRVKVGPVTMTYAGTARMTEVDKEAHRGRIEAAGKETRGTGSAKADVVASLVEDGDGTLVTVVTDLTVTGKPAQFGRGVMAEVGARIIDTFADRLRTMMEEEGTASAAEGVAATEGAVATESVSATEGGAPGASEAETPATTAEPGPEAAATGAAAAGGDSGTDSGAAATSGPRKIEQQPGREDDALDLMDVAGPAALKRLIPLVVGVIVIVGFIWWLRQR